MTGQASDQFFYEGHRLEIVGIQGTDLTTAEDFGIELASASTGCWRGYIMRYKIINKELVVEGFWVNTRSGKEMPEINGILPTRDHELHGLFKYEYRNLNLKVPFNGSIWLGKDFINSQYVHMDHPKSMSPNDLHEWIMKRFSLDIKFYKKGRKDNI